MKRTSTATGKHLIGKLINANKKQFIGMCYDLLKLFYDDLKINYELDVIVGSGNLFYCLATNNHNLRIDDFVNNKLNEIVAVYQNTGHITIICHKNLIDKELREANRQLIFSIYEKYGLTASSYTPTSFVEYIFAKARDVLYKSIDNANLKFKEAYQQRLSQEKIYIEDVPFIAGNKQRINPKKYVSAQFIEEQNSSAKFWTFVISEFGFGKTSLLINLPNKDKYKYIYIPISQFTPNSFTNETALAKSILEIIFEKELNTKNEIIDAILVTEFRQLLRFHKDIILLYDGLDEFRLSYKEQGLKQIFSCCTSFVCNSIFTVRKEFYDERNATFETALNVNQKPTYGYVELIEWKDREILKYIYELKSKLNSKKESLSYLLEFEKLINQKKYNDVYGDIPKRPLFLKMLCDDIMSGKTKIKNISQLYESYLTNKFKIDREGSVLFAKDNRPLSKTGDIIAVTDYIFELLAKIAWEMVTVNGISVFYNESIDEKSIIKLIKQEYDEIDIIELLLNSVLISFDKRKRREFKAKFAHKSFQEYFLAYYLIFIVLQEEEINTTALMLKYTQGTINFCKYMVKEVNGLQEKIDHIYMQLNVDIDKDSLLYKLATIDAHTQRFVSKEQNKEFKKEPKEYDFFISHSSKDKIPFVEDLVNELEILGLRVFYDKKSIGSADNIVWQINNGFINLKYGTIAIISPNFINSKWCNEELAIAYSLKVDKNKNLLPLLLNISENKMKEKYAILRTLKAIESSAIHTKAIAWEIFSMRE